MTHPLAYLALAINAFAALTLCAYCGIAFTRAAVGAHDVARRTVASGAISALGWMVAAGLLRTIELRTWTDLGHFAVLLALRTIVKRHFEWELKRKPSAIHTHG